MLEFEGRGITMQEAQANAMDRMTVFRAGT